MTFSVPSPSSRPLLDFAGRDPRREFTQKLSAGPKRGCPNMGAWNPQESGRKAPLSCNAAFSMLPYSFSLAAAQFLVKMTSALQKCGCCSATSAAQHSENCSATSVFTCGMLQGWGLEGWGLGLAEMTQNPRSQNDSAKAKGDGGTGTAKKKCHDNLRQTSRQFTILYFATICDILWQFLSLCSFDINVIKLHKSS